MASAFASGSCLPEFLAVRAHVCALARGELLMHKQAKSKRPRIEPYGTFRKLGYLILGPYNNLLTTI